MFAVSKLFATLATLVLAATHLVAADDPPLDCHNLGFKCEKQCEALRPPKGNTSPTNAAPSSTYHDYNDIKWYTCLEGCRMAVIVYPKSDADIEKYAVNLEHHV